ncbi:MAG: MBOAT family protein [Lachnospiraceae bacterium]|nr:MBOAT family protein [Lachnospiraceae bacterium]
MLFNSLEFAIFLPIAFAVYWLCPGRFRWVVLVLASCWFYMSRNPVYVVLLLFATAVSFAAGILMERTASPKRRRAVLLCALVLCLSVLFVFKYFNFFSTSISEVFTFFGMPLNPVVLNVLLPIGISFYTFQTLGYVIDVYKDKCPAEHHFGKYAAFTMFFPQIMAGPIGRAESLLPQIKMFRNFDRAKATYGLKQMAWGYFKKIAIADTIALYISKVFDRPHDFSGFSLVLAAVLFTVQIYCDFSGYSDIAIGCAKLMGIDLMKNFSCPYFSQSVREFWSRWHISLSTWFRDYVYIPLGGNRRGRIRTCINLLITFLISGLWHGANWTFVFWGFIHGLAQILENILVPAKKRTSTGIVRALRIICVFIFCSIAWVFFAANSIGDAFYMIGHMFDGASSPVGYLQSGFISIGLAKLPFAFLAVSVAALAAFDWYSLKTDVITAISSKKTAVRWLVYIILTVWTIFHLPASNSTEFIYFQF